MIDIDSASDAYSLFPPPTSRTCLRHQISHDCRYQNAADATRIGPRRLAAVARGLGEDGGRSIWTPSYNAKADVADVGRDSPDDIFSSFSASRSISTHWPRPHSYQARWRVRRYSELKHAGGTVPDYGFLLAPRLSLPTFLTAATQA